MKRNTRKGTGRGSRKKDVDTQRNLVDVELCSTVAKDNKSPRGQPSKSPAQSKQTKQRKYNGVDSPVQNKRARIDSNGDKSDRNNNATVMARRDSKKSEQLRSSSEELNASSEKTVNGVKISVSAAISDLPSEDEDEILDYEDDLSEFKEVEEENQPMNTNETNQSQRQIEEASLAESGEVTFNFNATSKGDLKDRMEKDPEIQKIVNQMVQEKLVASKAGTSAAPSPGRLIKSPSDTTLYAPGLVQKGLAQNELMDKITNFVEGIRMTSDN